MTTADDTQFGVDPSDLAACLRAIAHAEKLPPEHPDAVAIRRATGRMYKTLKQERRAARRDAIQANDKAVVAATATGSPNRIDDETEGIPLVSSARGALAGRLLKPRPCYICKSDYVEVDAFYHQLCPSCAASNHAHRDARTDLTGRRALLTGGRAKIGMYIALRLLRDGAHTTITTRFPNDAARRFGALPDSADWLHRLRIVGIDLRDPAQVVALADSMIAAGPLDILINNAAQTVRRTPGAYAPLAAAEADPLPDGPLPEILTFDHISDAHPHGPGGQPVRAPAAAPARHAERRRDLAARAGRGVRLAGADRDLDGHRRGRPGARPADDQQLDPARRRGRPAGTARGPAVQHDRAVHPDQPAARRDGGQRRRAASTS